MLFAGLDLASKVKNPSGLAILKDSKSKPKLSLLKNIYSDKQIIDALKKIDFLAIDAPLIKGEIPKGYRPAEKQLINLGLRLMTPSFLKELVLRAQNIINNLPNHVKVIEAHPRSSALMLGLNTRRVVFNQPKINKLLDTNNISLSNKHQFDALVSAYTAYLHQKKSIRYAGEDGSYIALPPCRSIKLAVFDMDGTLTQPNSSWEHIHRQLGTWENGGSIYLQKFLADDISYEEFADLDSGEWKGIAVEKIRTIAKRVKYNPGIRELIEHLRKNKIKIAVISGGLSVISDKIAEDFAIEDIFVNDLISDNGSLTGKVKINVSYNSKLPIYKKLLKDLKIKPYQAMTVGDTNGDIPLFKNSGLAVVINPINEEVVKAADFEVKSLAEIITLLE